MKSQTDGLKNRHKVLDKSRWMLKVDGSFGEGGGQIVRTAISLSCITKKAIKLENIRSNRKTPGLKPQHLTAIKLLAMACNANTSGLKPKSTTVQFDPGSMKDGSLNADMGTAASISLVLAAIVPAVSLCGKRLELSISGGTDVPWSPTCEYTTKVLGEAYSRMGIKFSAKIRKRGYYPKGGGMIDVLVEPCKKPNPIILDRKVSKSAQLFCSVSKIPDEIINSHIQKIVSDLESSGFAVKTHIKKEDAADPGGSVLVMGKNPGSIAGADSLFDAKHGFSAGKAFSQIRHGVDGHLSDMLVVPASITDGLTIFRVEKISRHLETNLHVASLLTGCKYGIGRTDDAFEVRIMGNSDACV